MKNKKITITLKNCRDDIAKTILIDTKMNMRKYCNVNSEEFRKKRTRIEVQDIYVSKANTYKDFVIEQKEKAKRKEKESLINREKWGKI